MAGGGWTEVRLAVPLGWHELVADELTRGPWSSVLFGLPSLGSDPAPEGHEYVRSFVPEEQDGEDVRAELVARLRSLADRSGVPELAHLAPEFHSLPREDWVNAWRKVWRPFRVGRLCVVTPDDAVGERRPGDVALRLEPGAAFGTGRHCTTRASLLALQERLRTGSRVLDAGTGSGILAVAAARLGAASVLAFDVDPRSCVEGPELAARNGVGDRCAFREGGFELLAPPEGPAPGSFDAVLANLYSDLLQRHAPDLARALAPGGWFAFSGCPERHAAATRARLEEAGLALDETRRRGRWMTFLGRQSGRDRSSHGGASSGRPVER